MRSESEREMKEINPEPGEIVHYIPSEKEQFLNFHEKCCAKLHEIVKRKNSDYTGTFDDPYKNFRKRGALGFLVRMDDKLARLESFIEKGSYEVQDESFLDTCLDLANYAILLAGYMKQEAKNVK
jgi:hypothetical protein